MNKIFLTTGVTLVVAAAIAFKFLLPAPTAVQAAPTPAQRRAAVVTATPRQDTLAVGITAYGQVAPTYLAAVNFPRAGQVTHLAVRQGQHVKKGATLATLTSDPSADAAYQQSVSALDYARREAARVDELYGLQLATSTQVGSARKTLADAQSNVDALRRLGAGMAQVDVPAPFDGYVASVSVAQGDRIAAGAAIMQLGDTDGLRVSFGVEPAERSRIRAGATVLVTSLQNPDAAFKAVVDEVQEQVDPQTQLINAVAKIPGKTAAALAPGMRVRGDIQVGSQAGWVMPRLAVLGDSQGSYVFQVRQGKAHRVSVEVMADRGDLLSVTGAIAPAEKIVVTGNYELAEGMYVREVQP